MDNPFGNISVYLQHVRIAAFDPGKRTGIAIIEGGVVKECDDIQEDFILRLAAGVLTTKAYPTLRWAEAANVWVMESWRLYPTMVSRFVNSDMPTCQIIGMLRVLAQRWDKGIVFQPAVNMKTAGWAEEWARASGVPKNVHQRDACRHGLLYFHKLVEAERKADAAAARRAARQ